MIQAQELVDSLKSALDAEGSDHYIFELDYRPAINSSIKWLTNVVSSAIGRDKIGEEFFRDITYSGIFKTDESSRVSLNVFPNEVWSILSVFVEPKTNDISGQTAPDTTVLTDSYFMNNLKFRSSYKSCKRLSIEEWVTARPNPFEDGYDGDQICDDLKQYAYLNPVNHENINTGISSLEIEVRPEVVNDYVAIFWTKRPSEIVNITDQIEFPQSVFQILFNKALNYMSYKQGDNTTINSVTDKDIALLLTVI